jgi:hypothetical protein
MVLFPQVSSATQVDVSAPDIMDPFLSFETDSSHIVRRTQHSRPLRQYIIEYKGAPTADYRIIRDFVLLGRHWVNPFEWYHSTALEPVTFDHTTPIVLHFTTTHGLIDGQWLGVFQSPNGNARNGFYPITRGGTATVLLNGSTAGGAGPGGVRIYFPKAVVVLQQGDTFPGAVKLIGPEAGSQGRWNFSVMVREEF